MDPFFFRFDFLVDLSVVSPFNVARSLVREGSVEEAPRVGGASAMVAPTSWRTAEAPIGLEVGMELAVAVGTATSGSLLDRGAGGMSTVSSPGIKKTEGRREE